MPLDPIRSNLRLFALGTLVSLFALLFYCDYIETFKDVLIGIFSSFLLLLLFEFRSYLRDKNMYGQLAGNYKRVHFYVADDSIKTDSRFKETNYLTTELVIVKYLGARKYQCEIDYPEGRVLSTFFSDMDNPNVGSGQYKYVSKKHPFLRMPDFGTCSFYVESSNSNLFVTHKNIYPSGLSEGIEEWERV